MIRDRWVSMSNLGARIMDTKVDRALAAKLRDLPHASPRARASLSAEVWDKTLHINRLARTAAKNW